MRYFPQGLAWQDGSLTHDLPMQRLSELFNVNFFIVSQVNPHAGLLSLGPTATEMNTGYDGSWGSGDGLFGSDGSGGSRTGAITAPRAALNRVGANAALASRHLISYFKAEVKELVKNLGGLFVALFSPSSLIGKALIPIVSQVSELGWVPAQLGWASCAKRLSTG